jgi:hypothetical protein
VRRPCSAPLAGTAAFALLTVCAVNAAAPQDTTSRISPSRDSTRQVVACTGQRVRDIVIHSAAPTIAALRTVPLAAEIARSVHATTKPDLIRRYLLMARGDRCTELRRTESERILRAQPFLADASVLAFTADSGFVDLEVRTLDETSAVIGGTVTSASPFLTAMRVGSSNLGGDGMYLVGNWRHDPHFRDGIGLRYTDYQLGAEPYILAIDGQQNPLGDHWSVESAYPFLTDLQRVAWSGLFGSNTDYVFFAPSQAQQHALSFLRRYYDLGGLIRIGPPGKLNLVGASISGERQVPASTPILVTPTGALADTTTAFVGRYSPRRIGRVNALWGIRDIDFVRARGFDALTANQDIPVGFQLGTQLGRSLWALGSREQDVFAAADLYMGIANTMAATRLQLKAEGRRSTDEGRWDGIVTSGRVSQYVKVDELQTAVASLDWSGGQNMLIPFALTLSDGRGGVRGYSNDTRPGARRAVARLEDRMVVGQPFRLGDAGVGVFADAGKLWAGDIPFGQTTPIRASVGLSILASVPQRSGRLWRLDVALPINPAGARRLEFRVSSSDHTSFFWREPDDVQLARERTVPASIFNWP